MLAGRYRTTYYNHEHVQVHTYMYVNVETHETVVSHTGGTCFSEALLCALAY